jgi:hypothetical protein
MGAIHVPRKRIDQNRKEDWVDSISTDRNLQPDATLAGQIAVVLKRHYPGHAWGIQVRPDQGIVTIRNMSLLGQWAFMIRMVDLDRPELRRVMQGAGELLEHYRLSRGPAKIEEYANIPKDFAGRHMPDM